MEEPRVSSAKNSRRRRWEVKSKESFETSLAVEIENSPLRKESTSKFPGKDSQFHRDISPKEKPKTSDDKSKESHKQTEKTPNKTSIKPSSATSRATGSKSARSKPSSARSKPSSAKSKPSSAKSTSGVKVSKADNPPNVDSDTDLLSAKLGALIEEANAKNKDLQRRSPKEKEKDHIPKDGSEEKHSPKDDFYDDIQKQYHSCPNPKDLPVKDTKDSPPAHLPKSGTPYHTIRVDSADHSPVDNHPAHTANDNPPGENRTAQENHMYSDDPPKYSERDNMMYSDDSSPEPSAPPLSSISPSPEWIPKMRKSKKKKSESQMLLLNAANEESFISLQLKELKDDVVDITRDKRIVAAPGLLRASSLPAVHGNINAMFRERIGGFVMTRQGDDGSPKLSERLQDPNQVKTRTSHAVFLQSGFRTFTVLCQGLLAGLTLAHCLLVSGYQHFFFFFHYYYS